LQNLIPAEGKVLHPRKNRNLERFRIAVNCYYDLYNNGLFNKRSALTKIFSINTAKYARSGNRFEFSNLLYELLEDEMNKIIVAAAEEQNVPLA
jgi:hypothetical protein